MAELGDAIVAASELSLDGKPRLIIDDRKRNAAFTQHGHLDKLRDHGIHVHMVRSAADMALGSGA